MLLKTGSRYCQIDFCRGMKGECRFSLTGCFDFIGGLTGFIQSSDSVEIISENEKIQHHRKIKFAFAACPNACTQPQIKDVGIIADLSPRGIMQSCSGCGKCISICKEQAIRSMESVPELIKEKCVGCGMCINQCPEKAIESNSMQFKILAGGRMGRHPRWAEHLQTVDSGELNPFIGRILMLTKHLNGNQRFANLIEKDGPVKIKESILNVQIK